MFDGVAFVAFVVADGDSVGVSIMKFCDHSNKITETFKLFYSHSVKHSYSSQRHGS